MKNSTNFIAKPSKGMAHRNCWFFAVCAIIGLLVLKDQLFSPLNEDYLLLRNTNVDRSLSRPESESSREHELEQQIRELKQQILEQHQKISELQHSSPKEQDFLQVASKTRTDKIAGHKNLPICLNEPKECVNENAEREECRPWGHFYDSIYNRWLGKYSSQTSDPIQFLEIGFYEGQGFESFTNFLPNAELHSMEISCLPEGEQKDGKWPWGNFANKHKWYEDLRAKDRLHCVDASKFESLHDIWENKMKRPDSPPLMAVVEDASHLSAHMATSLFFWFPRIEPGGILVVEDVQPTKSANKFRSHILPQVMKDLHWCGTENLVDKVCFPTIQPLLASVHCEMHICVFVRNDKPAYEPDEKASMPPPDAFDGVSDCLFVS